MAARTDRDVVDRDANEDPITCEHGAHPVGVGLGAAAGGAAAGAVAGTVAGPIGTVAGAIIGGLAGKAIAEQIDPTMEEHHWRNEYPNRDYYDPTVGYEEVGPAYKYGWESRAAHQDRSWDEVEPDLERNWSNRRGDSSLEWDRARQPVRDAWSRIDDTGFSLSDEGERQASELDRGDTRPPRVPK